VPLATVLVPLATVLVPLATVLVPLTPVLVPLTPVLMPLTLVLMPQATIHPSLATRNWPLAGNWLRFSCPIPAWFVLSHNKPMINTTSKLASFWHFLSPRFSLLRISLATGHCSPATRHPQLFPPTLPRWLLPDTDSRIGKDRTGPDLDDRPFSIQYVTKPGDRFGQIKLFLPTSRHSTVDHALVSGGAQRQWLQACPPDGREP